jgi:hypothetical protein
MRRPALATLAALLFVHAWAAAAAEPERRVGPLRSATWRLGAWGHNAEGLACWLRDRDGTWRLEVRRIWPGEASEPALDELLHQRGEGWTAVAAGGHGAFVQPWRGRFEELTPARQIRLGALLALAAAGRDAAVALAAYGAVMTPCPSRRAAARTPWAGRIPAGGETCLVTWPPGEGSDLRRRLEMRGLGRGDAVETWRVTFTEEHAWRLTSTRRTGTLQVAALPDSLVAYDPDEVFVPLWPLGEVLSPAP